MQPRPTPPRMPPLRFSANLKWLFTELPFEKRFSAAAEFGFDAVEIPDPYGYSTEALADWLGEAGLALVLINSPRGHVGGYGTACDPGAVRGFREGFERCLEYATALRVPSVHLMAGITPKMVSHDLATRTYIDNFSWAVDLSSRAGVTVLAEVLNQREHPGFVLASLDEAAGVLCSLGRSNARLLFDVYHVQVDGGNVMASWRALSGLVGHIQIADAPGRHEPGTGQLRWEELFCELMKSGYEGWVGCEYSPLIDTPTSLRWLRSGGLTGRRG